MRGRPESVVVVGAGLAGLACARELTERGARVAVVEKGRGVGGRTSTRREAAWRFDHGAARLELGAPELADKRSTWEAAGVVTPWVPQSAREHGATWIGVPGANALCAHLSHGLDVRTGQQVVQLARSGEAWRLVLETGAASELFDAVVLTAPPPQTRALLASASISAHDNMLEQTEMAPCLAAMVVLASRDEKVDDLNLTTGPLAQAYRMDRRPGRPSSDGQQAWVVHASEAWSRAHLEEDPDASSRVLASALAKEVGGEVIQARGHRWRYARATRRIPAPNLWDAERAIALAGDWFEAGTHAPAASRALLSGYALAQALCGG